jgi:serine/threonine protein kinase
MDSVGADGRVQLGCGLIKGLAYLHEHNIAHRDIKPDNLVCACDKDSRLQIIDLSKLRMKTRILTNVEGPSTGQRLK